MSTYGVILIRANSDADESEPTERPSLRGIIFSRAVWLHATAGEGQTYASLPAYDAKGRISIMKETVTYRKKDKATPDEKDRYER